MVDRSPTRGLSGATLSFALAIASVNSMADSPAPPRPYLQEASSGDCRFAMRPDPRDHGGRVPTTFPYARSGAYRADEAVPLWSVDWYAHGVSLLDCDRLVRHGPWAASLTDLAVSFHRRGNEVMAYTVDDLVTEPDLLHYTVSHFFWRHENRLDVETGLQHIETMDGHRYAFSVNTGEIVHHERRVIDDAAELLAELGSRRHALRFATERLGGDVGLLESIVEKHPHALCHALPAVRATRSVAQMALRARGDAYVCLDDALKRDVGLALMSLEGDTPVGLREIDEALHDDRKVVMAALRNTARDYWAITSTLRLDRDVVDFAMDRGVQVPLFSEDPRLRENVPLVVRALHRVGEFADEASGTPRGCEAPSADPAVRERCAVAIRRRMDALAHLSPALLDDPAVEAALDELIMIGVSRDGDRFPEAKADLLERIRSGEGRRR